MSLCKSASRVGASCKTFFYLFDFVVYLFVVGKNEQDIETVYLEQLYREDVSILGKFLHALNIPTTVKYSIKFYTK